MKPEQFYLYELIRKLRTVSASLVVCFLPMRPETYCGAKVYMANNSSFLLIYL